MNVVVVYESMFGNTHAVADAIAEGAGDGNLAVVVPVARADQDLIRGADLVVVGGPTHVHSMSRASTRQAAVEQAGKPGAELTLEAGADGPGLREWFTSLGQVTAAAAAFDTRMEGPTVLTGRASVAIGRQLRQHGFSVIAKPRSFLVTKASQLRPDENERARVGSSACHCSRGRRRPGRRGQLRSAKS
jgi:Flavodoxin